MAYAPADNPKIALAMIVENAGFGAQAAAPIARKTFDYFLLGKTPAAPAEDATVDSKNDKKTVQHANGAHQHTHAATAAVIALNKKTEPKKP
jgi:hypothetical protein